MKCRFWNLGMLAAVIGTVLMSAQLTSAQRPTQRRSVYSRAPRNVQSSRSRYSAVPNRSRTSTRSSSSANGINGWRRATLKWDSTKNRPSGLYNRPGVSRGKAPKPTAPPKDQRDYVFEDLNKPTPRPKASTGRNPFGLTNRPGVARGKAPKPTDPPADQRDYVFEDLNKPTPRPKASTGRNPFGLTNRPDVARGQAPKPTPPPVDQRDIAIGGNKKPKPRPKNSTDIDLDPFGTLRRDFTGPPPPRSRNNPRSAGKPSPFPRDIKVPYVHPPRDIKRKSVPRRGGRPSQFPRDIKVPYVHPPRDIKKVRRTRSY